MFVSWFLCRFPPTKIQEICIDERILGHPNTPSHEVQIPQVDRVLDREGTMHDGPTEMQTSLGHFLGMFSTCFF